MALKKEELDLLQKLNKKIAKAENAGTEPMVKNYVFKVIAGPVTRTVTIAAASKAEAEQVMIQRYGDLPYELIEVK